MSVIGVSVRCDACGGRLIVNEGERVCASCGKIHQPEERAEEATRRGAALGPREVELGSYLGPRDPVRLSGYDGLSFSGSSTAYMKKLSDYGIKDGCVRTREYVFEMIRRVGEGMNLPQRLVCNAQVLAARSLRQARVKKGGYPTLAAFCLVAASRQSGQGLVTWRRIRRFMSERGYRVRLTSLIEVSTQLSVKVPSDMATYLAQAVKTAASDTAVAGRMAAAGINQVRYAQSAVSAGRRMLDVLGKQLVSGYNPIAVTATVLYLYEREASTLGRRAQLFGQAELASILGTSQFTMREQASKFRKAGLRLERHPPAGCTVPATYIS
ncbi:MAG: hypothetical protein JRN39_05880 [Nitrososphaerota archaeon]|nr:hypothetical protein [Nitrososphaerota archaeon]MDG6939910.1 hypothetical protein [Nitrososphaerota archaeon]